MIKDVLLLRFLACAIDVIYLIPGAILFAMFNDMGIISLIIMLIMYILRDIFSERSLGKRVMELHIIDKNTCKPPSAKQKIIRNLFIIIGTFDIIVLLVKGESMGDIVSGTSIVKK